MWRTIRVLLLLLFFSAGAHAQKGTHTPYSILGLGELMGNDYAAFSAMGGVSMANTDSSKVNQDNPAMYSYISRWRPIFQIGFNGRFSTFETATASTNQKHFGLNQFQLGIPIKKRWGAGLGIKPYSFTGYTISNYIVEDGDSTQLYTSEGSGGVNKFYLGVSYIPLQLSYSKQKPRSYKDTSKVVQQDTFTVSRHHQLALGANANFLFGTSERTRTYQFALFFNEYNARVDNGLRISGLNYDFGLNYQFKWGATNSKGKEMFRYSLSVGAAYSPGISVRSYQDVFAYSYRNVGTLFNGAESIQDTIEFIRDHKGSIYIPEAYKGGVEFRIGPLNNEKKSSLLRIGIDARYQKWSAYMENFGSGFDNQLKDRMQLGFGLEWTPVSIITDLHTPFFSKLSYRLGFNYTMSELQFETSPNNYTGLTAYGMSFGLGVPITIIPNSNTNVNFGANLGNLGTTENGLIKEKYVGVFVGISITPGRGDLWFLKRKYD